MNIKKLILTNLPYLLFAYPFDKLAQAFRLALARTSPQSCSPSRTDFRWLLPPRRRAWSRRTC